MISMSFPVTNCDFEGWWKPEIMQSKCMFFWVNKLSHFFSFKETVARGPESSMAETQWQDLYRWDPNTPDSQFWMFLIILFSQTYRNGPSPESYKIFCLFCLPPPPPTASSSVGITALCPSVLQPRHKPVLASGMYETHCRHWGIWRPELSA